MWQEGWIVDIARGSKLWLGQHNDEEESIEVQDVKVQNKNIEGMSIATQTIDVGSTKVEDLIVQVKNIEGMLAATKPMDVESTKVQDVGV